MLVFSTGCYQKLVHVAYVLAALEPTFTMLFTYKERQRAGGSYAEGFLPPILLKKLKLLGLKPSLKKDVLRGRIALRKNGVQV
ncbi:MAG: hypothetical protein PUP92_26610, partial [Rhizonema sp. PD38]|nr:hypothetical protein [Rhizonema sp. PD38]